MKLSEENRRILLINLHQIIAEYANTTADHLLHKKIDQLINYPPNGGLTDEEAGELAKLAGNEQLRSALSKILASNSAEVIFSLLNFIDGTTDPDIDADNWGGVMLVDLSEDNETTEMLHDEFFATYREWKDKGGDG